MIKDNSATGYFQGYPALEVMFCDFVSDFVREGKDFLCFSVNMKLSFLVGKSQENRKIHSTISRFQVARSVHVRIIPASHSSHSSMSEGSMSPSWSRMQ